MTQKERVSWREGIEILCGLIGAIVAGVSLAGAIAGLTPGAVSFRNVEPVFVFGSALLLSSYLVFRSRALLLGRIAQGFLVSAIFGVLALLPALIRFPGEIAGWLYMLAFCGAGTAVYRISPRIRAAIDAESR